MLELLITVLGPAFGLLKRLGIWCTLETEEAPNEQWCDTRALWERRPNRSNMQSRECKERHFIVIDIWSTM